MGGRFFASRPLTFLGKYSYGLYVFHAMLSYALSERHALDWFLTWIPQHFVAILVQATLSISASILIAVLSYHGFEQRFLALKVKYEAPKV